MKKKIARSEKKTSHVAKSAAASGGTKAKSARVKSKGTSTKSGVKKQKSAAAQAGSTTANSGAANARLVAAKERLRRRATPEPRETRTLSFNEREDTPVVAIGCSAGGLEALTAILRTLPDSTGMNFLVMQHLGEDQEQQLATILKRETSMRIIEPKDGEVLEPDTLYVLSSHRPVGIFNRRIVNENAAANQPGRMAIDDLLLSLADDVESCAIGVILSGNGSDGSRGVAKIKERGGITFAQDKSAKYLGMPESAISTGQIDFVLDPPGIATELQRIARNPYVRQATGANHNGLFKDPEDLNRIFMLLRSATGVDFSSYKENTIKRRIYRRMVLSKIETLPEYIRYLNSSPTEAQILHDDFLINVTSFFRDPESFDALKEKVFPEITREHDADTPIRIWIPGCSTGEEAYSIAIALLEYVSGSVVPGGVQIFATDLSEAAINKARKGLYLENITQEVSSERLRRFFKKVDGGYQIAKNVRDLCVFAKQNMTKDPPFSRIDLISCRNVLIYLSPGQQKSLIRTFHHALQPNGFLMLGTSETIGPSADLFHLIDKKNKSPEPVLPFRARP